jgi:2,3-bisphosphoglycerate-independent phosphoglycerate mutase
MPEFVASLAEGVTVGTVSGRYYAMDRDNRWERVGLAYDVIVSGKGCDAAGGAASAVQAVAQAHAAGLTDEFVLPTRVGDYSGVCREGKDGIMMCNFRADRAREILSALADPDPPTELWEAENATPERAPQPAFADVAGAVKYSDRHNTFMSSLFPSKKIIQPLGEVVADAGLSQLRTAETEKYPHVTFFFNGGREEPFVGESRYLVASPKVATYDLQPEMSAPEVGRRLCAALDEGKFNMVVVNFANPDMVGHTGDLKAAIAACEAVDDQLGPLIESVRRRRGALVVTADHGNCEKMWEASTGQPHTAHTLNKVPVILANFQVQPEKGTKGPCRIRSGRLADLAPTVLELLGVEKPGEMTGESLIVPRGALGELPDGPRMVRPPL